MIKQVWLSCLNRRTAGSATLGILIFLLSLGSARGDEGDKQFVFHENVESAPYMYRHKSATGSQPSAPQGYLPALMKYFSDDHGIDIKYIEVPPNRLESSLQKKELHGAMLNKDWIDSPENFVFSQPLALYRTVLFTSDMDNVQIQPLEDIKSQYICAHRGYRYPNLDKLWEKNDLIRVDFADELLQLKGLVAQRCQYAVMDEAIGLWYAKKHFKKNKISLVSEESRLPLTIGFHKDKAEYAGLFQSTISRLQANGELSILQRVFKVNPYQSR